MVCSYANAEMIGLSIEKRNEMSCLFSDGIPKHQIGKFPNKANPNKLMKQNLTFCFPTKPALTNRVTWGLMTVGVSLNGIPFRPYTADFYDKKSLTGFSDDPSSGWRKQAMHEPRRLGIDFNNGHVDKSGLYHYHGFPDSLVYAKDAVLIGFAPDGFKIFYSDLETTSWKLKVGKRPLPPGGNYDGTFEEDFEYIAGLGSLDKCNGTHVNGEYTYFATNSYPYFPRCFKGLVNATFLERN